MGRGTPRHSCYAYDTLCLLFGKGKMMRSGSQSRFALVDCLEVTHCDLVVIQINAMKSLRRWPCALLLHPSWALNYVEVLKQSGAAVFGTENGYDRGGPDPICWVSTFNTTDSAAGPGTEESATSLNQQFLESLQAGNSSDGVYLLPRCFPQTNVFVDVYPAPAGNITLYTESEYTFTIHVELNQSALFDSGDESPTSWNGTDVVHGRLLLCHAFDYGFCNPINNIHESAQDVTASHHSVDDISVYSSSWVTQPLSSSNAGDEVLGGSIEVSVDVPTSMLKGPYVVVAHFFVALQNEDQTITRFDIAGTIPGKILDIRTRPLLREVSLAAKIALGGMIVICGAFALFLLVVILVHRKHAVMRLAQGPFLAAIAAGCFVQICCSFLHLPTRDIHCRLFGVLIMTPMTFVSCCIIGRIWRVYQTLSIANRMGRRGFGRRSSIDDTFVSTLTSISNFSMYSPARRNPRSTRSNFRQAISTTQTANLVLALTLPMLLLQVLSASLRDRHTVLITDPTGSVQRLTCEADPTVSVIGTAYALALAIVAVWLAWLSRHLPSNFNEKDQVYIASSACLILIFTSVALRNTLEAPEFSPDASVLLYAICSLIVPMTILAVVVYPKVQRVLSGEKVVISSALEGKFSMRRRGGILPHTSSETCSSIRPTRPPAITTENRRISLQDDDPLPVQVESLLFNVQRVLHTVTDTITQGRAPNRTDVIVLGEEAALLADELLLIDFAAREPNHSSEIKTSGEEDTTGTNLEEKHVTFSSESTNI